MPAYEYVLEVRGKEVARVTAVVQVKDRDAVKMKRVTIPRMIGTRGVGHEQVKQRNQVLRGFARSESRIGTTEMRRRLGNMTFDTVKRAWATD